MLTLTLADGRDAVLGRLEDRHQGVALLWRQAGQEAEDLAQVGRWSECAG
jgi:hypothetical protein